MHTHMKNLEAYHRVDLPQEGVAKIKKKEEAKEHHLVIEMQRKLQIILRDKLRVIQRAIVQAQL